MRIAFDYQIFCLQSYGGISRYFTRLAHQLIARNQEVVVFAAIHRNHHLKELLNGRAIYGRALNRYPPKTGRLMLSLNHIISRQAIKNWHPQVVHETYYSRWPSSPKGFPTVVTVYDMIHELFSDEFPAQDKTTFLKRMAVDRADHVICISENTRRDLVSLFGVKEEKVSVVHLGFECFTSNVEPKNKTSKPVKPYLLYVGMRRGYKNFDRLVQAVASSERLKADFDIVAFGGGKFSPSEIEYIKKCGFSSSQVRQLEGNDALLGALYDKAEAFVFPSLYEGFGLPPLEAMAHQCPVISSNTSSMPEVIGDAAVYFNPTSVDDMAAAIESVVYSSSRSQDLIERGRKRLELFSWEHCAENTLEIYRSLVGHA